MTDLDRRILATIHANQEAAEEAPEPPAWKVLAHERWQEAREFGPRYSPIWFGDLAADEALRTRILRRIHALDSAGMVQIVRQPHSGRLRSVVLTGAGLLALANLALAEEIAEFRAAEPAEDRAAT